MTTNTLYYRKPKQLKPGDRVAIVSPSWGGPSKYPGIYELGLKVLEEVFNLVPVEFPTARMSPLELRNNPKIRANDINTAFADEDISGIISSIGGDDSVRILKYLDKEVLRNNPKLVLGYSDFSTILTYLSLLGNVTCHGPAVMAGFAQVKALGPEYERHLKDILFGKFNEYTYRQYRAFSTGYPDWNVPENLGKVKDTVPASGWKWLQKSPAKTGYFWGGCIEVLEFMKGTEFWPEISFFNDKFLVFETSEEKPSPTQVLRFLRNYGTQTILDRIQGVIFGRANGYSPDENKLLKETVREVVVGEHGRKDIPIIMDFDFGHTDPQVIVPFGIKARIDSENEKITLIENIFE